MKHLLDIKPKAVESLLRLWKERFGEDPPKRPERSIRKWLARAVRGDKPEERLYDGWIILLEDGAVTDVRRSDWLRAPIQIPIPVWNRFIQLHMKYWPLAAMPDEAKLIETVNGAAQVAQDVRIADQLIFSVDGANLKQVARVPKLSPAATEALVDDYGHSPEEATLVAYRAALHGRRAGGGHMRSRGFDAAYGIIHQGRLYAMAEDVTILDVVPAD